MLATAEIRAAREQEQIKSRAYFGTHCARQTHTKVDCCGGGGLGTVTASPFCHRHKRDVDGHAGGVHAEHTHTHTHAHAHTSSGRQQQQQRTQSRERRTSGAPTSSVIPFVSDISDRRSVDLVRGPRRSPRQPSPRCSRRHRRRDRLPSERPSPPLLLHALPACLDAAVAVAAAVALSSSSLQVARSTPSV